MGSFSIHAFALCAHLVSSLTDLPTGQSHGCHGDGERTVNNGEKSMSKKKISQKTNLTPDRGE